MPTKIDKKARALVKLAFALMDTTVSQFSNLDFSFDSAPGLPESLYTLFPKVLTAPGSYIQRAAERDVFTISALTVASGALPQLEGQYGLRCYSANVVTVVFGQPGAGKGMVGVASRLLSPLDDRLRREAELDLAARAREERMPSLLLPGNTSAAALYTQLSVNGGKGVMIETEADTINSAQANEWGNIGFILRQAAENETISVARAKDPAPIIIPFPQLSCLIAGTPGQILKLLPSAEDGLVSRVHFFYAPHDPRWHSGRPATSAGNFEAAVDASAATIDQVHAALSAREVPLQFDLTDAGWDLHDAVFGSLKEWANSLKSGGALISLLHRRGTFAFRCSMVSAAFRTFERGENLTTADTLVAQPEDIEAGILAALQGLDHGARLLGVLPSQPIVITGTAQVMAEVFEQLEHTFHSSDIRDIVTGMGMNARTAHNYLATWRSKRKVSSIGKGKYQKFGYEPGITYPGMRY